MHHGLKMPSLHPYICSPEVSLCSTSFATVTMKMAQFHWHYYHRVKCKVSFMAKRKSTLTFTATVVR